MGNLLKTGLGKASEWCPATIKLTLYKIEKWIESSHANVSVVTLNSIEGEFSVNLLETD